MSNDNSTNKEQVHTQEASPAPQNPAMLVKTPSLPVKTEFSQDNSKKDKPENDDK